MITWLRNADADEAEFFALVAAEAGVASGASPAGPDVVRVAVHDGQVVGFARAVLPDHDRDDARLDYLVVHGNRRGRGVGRTLLNDVVRAAALTGSAGLTIVAHPASAGFFDRTAAVRIGTEAAHAAAPWCSPVYRLPGAADPPARATRARARPVG